MPITRAYAQAATPVQELGNPIINGGMDIWQRGTSVVVTASTYPFYTADRWQCYRGATGSTVSRQTTGDTTNLPNIQYCARVQRDSGNTSTAVIYFNQSLESVNSIPFAGKTVTLSFYARAGANFSSASSAVPVVIQSGTGTDQNFMGSVTGATTVIGSTITLTTTWQRFTLTGTVGATATQLFVDFRYTPVGTAGAADYFEVTGVQLDVGTYTATTAPTFRRSGGTLAGELAAAMRYYQIVASGAGVPIVNGIGYSTTTFYGIYKLSNAMRTTPTLSIVTGTDYYAVTGNGNIDNCNSFSLDIGNTQQVRFKVDANIALTQGYAYMLESNNSSAFVGLQAEL